VQHDVGAVAIAPHQRPRMRAAGLLILVVALTCGPAAPAQPVREPKPHADAPSEVAGGPLDLVEVTLGQVGTDLLLRVRTAGDWSTNQLSTGAGRTLCVRFFFGAQTGERSRICVIPRSGEAGLRYTRPNGRARAVTVRPVSAVVSRPDARTVEATFRPAEVNLNMGRYSWQAETRWHDSAACVHVSACTDRFPNNGPVIAAIRPLVEPPCFGAAARNPRHRCANPALRLAVVPEPADALIAPNARCTPIEKSSPFACLFGARPVVARGTIALVGDSHAQHLRGALEVVAQSKRWRGVSLTRAGCPFSTAPSDLPRRRRAACTRWNRSVRQWFVDHPSVRTVFVGQRAAAGVIAPRGRNAFEYQVRGYIDAWNRLAPSVKQIVLIRDTPLNSRGAVRCVLRAIAARRSASERCAVKRSSVLKRDAGAAAGRRARSRRVHVVDLTRYMCSRRSCFPVVGGALVHKDETHLTEVFAATLGPFLLRAVNRLGA
jgi:SGNH domain (fused to AT3 domains)